MIDETWIVDTAVRTNDLLERIATALEVLVARGASHVSAPVDRDVRPAVHAHVWVLTFDEKQEACSVTGCESRRVTLGSNCPGVKS